MRIYKAIASTISGAVGLALLEPLLQGEILNKGFSAGWSKAISIAVAAVSIVVIEALLVDFPMRFRWIRQQINPLGRIEGVWAEYAPNGARPISIATLKHANGKWTYCGSAYDKDGVEKAGWEADSLSCNIERLNLSFEFHGKGYYIQDGAPHIGLGNVGRVNFTSSDIFRDKLTMGQGFYFDYDVTGVDCETTNSFTMRKITHKMIFDVLGKKKIQSPEDKSEFVRKFWQHLYVAKEDSTCTSRLS